METTMIHEPITTIPLADQIVAVLRLKRSESVVVSSLQLIDICKALGRVPSETLRAIQTLYETGIVLRRQVGTDTHYMIAYDSTRTKGCCVCCDQKLFSDTETFCQECGPHFTGRV